MDEEDKMEGDLALEGDPVDDGGSSSSESESELTQQVEELQESVSRFVDLCQST